jgi:hypothetical protein
VKFKNNQDLSRVTQIIEREVSDLFGGVPSIEKSSTAKKDDASAAAAAAGKELQKPASVAYNGAERHVESVTVSQSEGLKKRGILLYPGKKPIILKPEVFPQSLQRQDKLSWEISVDHNSLQKGEPVSMESLQKYIVLDKKNRPCHPSRA